MPSLTSFDVDNNKPRLPEPRFSGRSRVAAFHLRTALALLQSPDAAVRNVGIKSVQTVAEMVEGGQLR
jgi:hypothetical protein